MATAERNHAIYFSGTIFVDRVVSDQICTIFNIPTLNPFSVFFFLPANDDSLSDKKSETSSSAALHRPT